MFLLTSMHRYCVPSGVPGGMLTDVTSLTRIPGPSSPNRYDVVVTRALFKRPRRATICWLFGATALWIIAAAVDRRTEIVIDNLGRHLRFAVAGTEIVIPSTIRSVEGMTLWTADSVDPLRLVDWELTHDGETAKLRTSRRLSTREDAHPPVGDWWVDGRSETRAVVEHETALDGAFENRLVVVGRTSSEMTLSLDGNPSLHLSLRRGMMDNYLAIRADDGSLVDVTTLDPTPIADLGALTAQLLRAGAAACLVIAFIGALASMFPNKDPGPRASKARTKCPNRKTSSRLFLLATLSLAVLATAFSVWTAIEVLGGLPHQIDEVVDLLQARWLLDGEVAPVATTIQEHLRIPFTYLADGRWVGHYPVGWPAVLAIGLAVGAPHLVNSVLGAIFILLVFLVGREMDDDLTGLAAAVLATLSPLIRLLSASMFPHLACAVLVTLAVWLLMKARNRSGWWWGAGAGLAMGCCLAVRPMTAVAVSLVLGGWLVQQALATERSRSTWATMGFAVAAGLVASLPTLAHNAAVTGNAFSLPYSLTTGAMYHPSLIPFGLRNLDGILLATSSSLFGWGWPVAIGGLASALSLAFIAVPFLLRRSRPEDVLLLVLLLVVALGHLPTRAHGLHGYGARYAVDVAACLILLSARGFRELARWARPSRIAVGTVAAIFLVLNLSTLVVLPTRLNLYRGYYDVTGSLERQVEDAGLTEAVILVDGGDWKPWAEGARLMTGPGRHEIVIGTNLGDNWVIENAYPDRPVFIWDGETLRPDDRGGD